MISRNDLDKITTAKTFAVAGVSRSGKKMGNHIFKKLISEKKTVYPINKNCDIVESVDCYKSIEQLPEMPEVIITAVSKEKTNDIVLEAAQKGIKYIWTNNSRVDKTIEDFCKTKHLTLVQNQCYFMHDNPSGIHKIHRTIKNIFGTLPK